SRTVGTMRVRSHSRPGGSAVTRAMTATATPSTTNAQPGMGKSPWVDVPDATPNMTSSTKYAITPTAWFTATLVVAPVVLTPDVRRYWTMRATPPTDAGVTNPVNEAASWARTVRPKESRSRTNPISARAAPT